MILLLALRCALAEPPDVFDPFVFDATVDEHVYHGFMVDEAWIEKYSALKGDLVQLRADQAALQTAYEAEKALFVSTMQAERTSCSDSMTSMRATYDAALIDAEGRVAEAGKRTFWEKHGQPIMFATGVVTTMAVVVGTAYIYKQIGH